MELDGQFRLSVLYLYNTSLILLIPGGSLYYTMVHAFSGDYDAFLPRTVYTLQLAATLALGIIVSTALARAVNKLKTN